MCFSYSSHSGKGNVLHIIKCHRANRVETMQICICNFNVCHSEAHFCQTHRPEAPQRMSFSRRQHTHHITSHQTPIPIILPHSSVVHSSRGGSRRQIRRNRVEFILPSDSLVAARMIEGNTTFGRRAEGLREMLFV